MMMKFHRMEALFLVFLLWSMSLFLLDGRMRDEANDAVVLETLAIE